MSTWSWSSWTALHSRADAVSGDFSSGASGFLCRNGERVAPVRGITVAGNFYRLLGELEAVGNQLHHDDGKGLLCPADPLWRAQHCRQIKGGALLGSSPSSGAIRRRFLSMRPDSRF